MTTQNSCSKKAPEARSMAQLGRPRITLFETVGFNSDDQKNFN